MNLPKQSVGSRIRFLWCRVILRMIFLLAYALVGAADFLVTGDKDLLVLKGELAELQIVTPTEFVLLLAGD